MSLIEKDLNYIREIIYQFYKTRSRLAVNRIVKKYGMDYNDIFQVASIAYLRGEKNFNKQKGVKFQTFIAFCIKNELGKIARDHSAVKRNSSNVTLIPIDKSIDDETNLGDVIPSPEDDFSKVEDRLTIQRFLNLLTEEERHCVVMSYIYEKSQKEIGKVIGVNQTNVSPRIKRAISKMQAVGG